MGGPGSGVGGPGPGERFPGMQSREIECRCSRGHCSPTCPACLRHGLSRCKVSIIRKAKR